MFNGTIILLLVALLLPLNSSASATSINRDSVASNISSNDETDDINSTSNYDNLLNSNDSIDEGCDISFPLAPTTLPSSHHHGRHLKVAIPPYTQSAEQQWYETGEYYATTCHDITTNKRRIDIRYLEQCFGGACWDTKIGQCTFVCTWNKPTPLPTKQPTPPPTYEQVQTEHPLLLNLRNLPSEYRFNSELRAAILRYISDKLKADLKELDINMDLIQITSPGRLPGKPHSIPLKISVNAPSDISDFALSYILQTLRDEIPVITSSLSKLDGTSSFDEQVQLIVETYNFDDVTDGYDTVAPSKSPTMEPEEVIVPSNVEYKDANEKQGTPWWVWLLVALVIISCLLGTCCYCTRKENKDDKNELQGGGGQQQINLFLQNRMHHPTKDGQSVAMSHRSRQQQHPRIGNGDDAFLGQPIAVKRSTRDDDVSRLTSRTKRSHKTSSSSRKKQHQRSGPPRRELELATIPQEDPPEESVVNGEGVVVGRDPTMYQEEGYKSSHSQLDPEGDKLSKKKSMFASGALMNEVHREREQNQSSSSTRRRGDNMNRRKSMDKLVSSFRWTKKQEPTEYNEGAIVAVPEPPEEYDTDYAANNTNNKHKSSSTSKNNRRGNNNINRRKSMDKLVSSFRWTKKQDPIDIDMDELEDCPQIDLEVGSCDSPSILTNHNPGDGDLPSDRNPYQRDANTNEDYSGYERNETKNKSAKKKTKKDSGGGNRRASRQNRTAGAFRSFRKSISWGDGGDAADDDSYDRN